MDFIFGSKIVLNFVLIICCQINISIDMSDQQWFSSFNNLSFHLKSENWISIIDCPQTVSTCFHCISISNLLLRKWSTYSWSLLLTCKFEILSEKEWIGLNAELLSISHILVTDEHVCWIVFFNQSEYGTSHWSWILTGTC